MQQNIITLSAKDIPSRWYNIQPDLPAPLKPPVNPKTHKPIGPQELAPIFPMELIKQEVSMEPWVEIPDEITAAYRLWRPTPLHRALRLEKALNTPARIYFKNESVSPPGAISRTPPWPRRIIIKKKACSASLPKPVPDNGEVRFPSPAICLIWNAWSIWLKSAMSKNLTASH